MVTCNKRFGMLRDISLIDRLIINNVVIPANYVTLSDVIEQNQSSQDFVNRSAYVL